MKENEGNKDGVKKVSISDFIEANSKLITTLAFFTALTAFAGSLPLKPLGYLLSFFCAVASVLIWGELGMKLPPPEQWDGFFFFFVCTLACIFTVIQVYCLIEFASVWAILFYPIFFCLSACFLFALYKVLVSPKYRHMALPNWMRSKRLFWGFCVLFILLLLFVTPRLNRFLINMRQRMEETNSPPMKIERSTSVQTK